MTNEPDVNFRFDAETGEESDDSRLAALEQAEEALLVEARELEKMRKSKGWKIFEAYVRGVIEQATQLLVDEKDLKSILRHQAIIRAYSNCLGLVEQKVFEGISLREQRNLTSKVR